MNATQVRPEPLARPPAMSSRLVCDTLMLPSALPPSKPIKRQGMLDSVRPTPEKRPRIGLREEAVVRPPGFDRNTVRNKFTSSAAIYQEIRYEYKQLEDDQIRLAVLKPNQDPEADIEVQLRHVNLALLGAPDSPNKVIALSYNWGDGQAEYPIYVEEEVPHRIPNGRSFGDYVYLLQKFTEGKTLTEQNMRELNSLQLGRRRLHVKPSLYYALRQLRDKNEERVFWIDALCINQMSDAEKQRQVARMWEIYSRADHVLVWLGVADGDGRTDRAMRFIPTILLEHNIQDRLLQSKHVADWAGLLYLMRSRWFSRRWVIQEIALARDAVVQCGSQMVHWMDLSDAIGLFSMNFQQVRDLLAADAQHRGEAAGIDDISPLGAKILVDELANMFHRDDRGRLYEPQRGLETLVCVLSTFETSDPRDTIFTLLNLARETCRAHVGPRVAPDPANPPPSLGMGMAVGNSNPPPSPNYTQDLFHIYAYFVRWVVRRSGSLDIVCRQWALPEITNRPGVEGYPDRHCRLPTWIRTVPESSYGRQTDVFRGRQNGDSLVGLPGEGCYAASHGLRPDVKFGFDPEDGGGHEGPGEPDHQQQQNGGPSPRAAPLDDPSPSPGPGDMTWLQAAGIQLAKVVWRTDPIADGVIPSQALRRLGWKATDSGSGSGSGSGTSSGGEAEDGPIDRVWRTLIADRTSEGRKPTTLLRRACLRCLVNDTPNGHINTKELLQQGIVVANNNHHYGGGGGGGGGGGHNNAGLRSPIAPAAAHSPSSARDLLVQSYLRRVQAVTWNRVVLEAEGRGETVYGIGPPETRVGDLVVILFGCSVPVILREQGPNRYEFVGEAFIFGKMEGEAVTRWMPAERERITTHFRIY
ncbi:hypothetical protein RB601_005182 [Gaeumannomyces tritici]